MHINRRSNMIKQKLIPLYKYLVRSRYVLPGLAFIMVFTFVAIGTIADRPTDAFADTYTAVTVPSAADNSPTGPGTAAGNSAASKPAASNSTTTAPGSPASGTAPASGQATKPAQAVAPAVKPAPAPAPAPTPSTGGWTYPLHTGIKTTYFWAGEAASADNDFIQNVSSAWQSNWAAYFGGEDDPHNRCGYNPCGFTPKENPFYFALPFGDFTETGQAPGVNKVHWYNTAAQSRLNGGHSILKNRWIQVNLGAKTVYAQWQDVGPFYSDDSAYVFGTAAPKSTRAGLDVSPAVRDYLGMGGSATTSWRFVTDAEVPAGPWKTTVTTSGTDWN